MNPQRGCSIAHVAEWSDLYPQHCFFTAETVQTVSMSGSYRLQTSRPRPPPAPLRFDQSSFRSTSVVESQQGSPTLLYDLPSPTSPTSKPRLISPTSPSFHTRSNPGALASPPSARNRSTTPLGVAPNELETFADHCRSWSVISYLQFRPLMSSSRYFSQNEESGRIMTQTLATLPPSQRAPFSRLQASIRSAYHRSVNARRNAEFRAHLAATQPGGSLMPHSRADPQGCLARKGTCSSTSVYHVDDKINTFSRAL